MHDVFNLVVGKILKKKHSFHLVYLVLFLFHSYCHSFPQRHLGLSRGITILQNLTNLYRLIRKHTPTQKQNTNCNNNDLNLHSLRYII